MLFGVYLFKNVDIQHNDLKILYPKKCEFFHVFQ